MLCRCANGFGAVALSTLLADEALAHPTSSSAPSSGPDPLAPQPSHFQPRAKSVIFLYMDGGPSQVDTFDPKPRLSKEDGQPFGMVILPQVGHYTVVLECGADGASLVDSDQIDTWVAHWGQWLAALSVEPGLVAASVIWGIASVNATAITAATAAKTMPGNTLIPANLM